MADDTLDLTAGVALDDIPADGLLAGKVGDADVMLARWTDDAGPPAGERAQRRLHPPRRAAAQRPAGRRHAWSARSTTPASTCATARRSPRRPSRRSTRGPVTVEGDRVTVRRAPPSRRRAQPSRVDNDRGVTRVVVVGGGAGGFAAVERLRRVGYTGALALVSAEPNLPLDRPELSKNYLSGGKQVTDLPLLPASLVRRARRRDPPRRDRDGARPRRAGRHACPTGPS